MYQQFLDVVLASRESKGLTREASLAIADGRVFIAEEAMKHKLVDEIAYLPDVLEEMKAAIGDPHAAIIALEYEDHFRGNIYARGGSPTPRTRPTLPEKIELNLLNFGGGERNALPSDARFFYVWMPGS